MPDLVKAGPTCRVFQQFRAERVREAINRCLLAAQQRWGSELVDTISRFTGQIHDGIDPTDFSFLPYIPPPFEYAEHLFQLRLKGRGDDGKYIMEKHTCTGAPRFLFERGNGIGVYCGSDPKFPFDIKLGSVSIDHPRCLYDDHIGCF